MVQVVTHRGTGRMCNAWRSFAGEQFNNYGEMIFIYIFDVQFDLDTPFDVRIDQWIVSAKVVSAQQVVCYLASLCGVEC